MDAETVPTPAFSKPIIHHSAHPQPSLIVLLSELLMSQNEKWRGSAGYD